MMVVLKLTIPLAFVPMILLMMKFFFFNLSKNELTMDNLSNARSEDKIIIVLSLDRWRIYNLILALKIEDHGANLLIFPYRKYK